MNYSKVSKQGKQILILWFVIIISIIIVAIVISLIGGKSKAVDDVTETTANITTAPETTTEPIPEVTYTSLGEYKLTAYCACEKCCEYWATVRPLDEDGNPIVYTANQSIAKQGVTVSADINVLPFGTVLLIDDHEYIVQDRGGAVNGNHIDIYFDSHEDALQFGVQYKEVFMKEKNQ